MNQEQFKTFMGKIDRSLSEIGSEINQTFDDPRVFVQALIRRVRQGFMEITKQVAHNNQEATSVDLFYQNENEVAEMFN